MDDRFTNSQLAVRYMCDQIAEQDGISTVRWACEYNDGVDCEYTYLDCDNGDLWSVVLTATEFRGDYAASDYEVEVRLNVRDARGMRSREWEVVSSSTMVPA